LTTLYNRKTKTTAISQALGPSMPKVRVAGSAVAASANAYRNMFDEGAGTRKKCQAALPIA
jgi:hypothetical protein